MWVKVIQQILPSTTVAYPDIKERVNGKKKENTNKISNWEDKHLLHKSEFRRKILSYHSHENILWSDRYIKGFHQNAAGEKETRPTGNQENMCN